MIFYSVVYSLGTKSNQYIQMFLMLLKTLVRTKSFCPKSDRYILLADEESIAALKELNMFFALQVLQIPKPKTHLEGMLWKYKLPEYVDCTNQICWYLDVDMLFLNQVKMFPAPDHIICFPEGAPTDKNYCGSFTLVNKVGFSAGTFCYWYGPTVKTFLEKVLNLAKESKETFYTVEQPFFNKALEDATVTILDPNLISFNGHNLEHARILNLCGDPGDDQAHFKKMFAFYLRLF